MSFWDWINTQKTATTGTTQSEKTSDTSRQAQQGQTQQTAQTQGLTQSKAATSNQLTNNTQGSTDQSRVSQTSSTAQTQQAQTLDSGTLELIRANVADLSGKSMDGLYGGAASASAADQKELADIMTARALGTTDFMRGEFGAIKDEQIRKFETDTMRDINAAAQRMGSRNSTFFMQTLGESRAALGSGLAAAEGELLLKARTAESADLASAFSAGTAAGADLRKLDEGSLAVSDTLARLTSVLKGGEVSSSSRTDQTLQQDTSAESWKSQIGSTLNKATETGESQQVTNTQQDTLSGIMEQILARDAASTTTSGTSERRNSAFDWLSLLATRAR